MAKIRIYNKKLCPLLWQNMSLDAEVRRTLLTAAKDFYEKTKFKAPIKDIYFMGSAANYNWTPDSDADVHIIIDFNQLQMPRDTAEKMIKTVASQWNSEHDIRVKGHKVELNFQDSTENKPHVTGIYSLIKNQWIRIPKMVDVAVDRIAITSKYTQLKNYIEKAILTGEREYMKSVKEFVDAFRQYGLDMKGELSTENIVFKVLRGRGILKKLKNAITKTYDVQLSVQETLEKWYQQQSVNEVDYEELGEGYGAGVPEEDRLNIRNPDRSVRRWQVQSKDAPKTPKMPKEEISEVTQKDIKSRHPQFPAGTDTLSKMTLDNLKALRSKEYRFWKSSKQSEDQAQTNYYLSQFKIYDAEIKRRMSYINSPVAETQLDEMPQMSLKGKQAFAGDSPLKKLPLEDIQRNIVMFRNDKETFFPAGYTLVYFMDSEESAQDMTDGKIPYLMIPRGTFHSGGSPITDVWKKKFQQPGTEHILGLIEGVSDENEVFIDMISVRPGWRRNRIASMMEAIIKKNFPNAKLSTSSKTDQGEKFYSRPQEGFDPTSMGPNPEATEGQPQNPDFYQDNIVRMQKMGRFSLKEFFHEL